MGSSPTPQASFGRLARRYAIQRKLGAGSMGTVYLAQDTEAERLVALKLLRSELLTPRALERLQAEFRALARLRHPRIAQAYDFGYTDVGGVPFYTREYVPGSPLELGPPGGEAPLDFLQPILDLLEAVEHLHMQGVLHLDIHAGNLIRSNDPRRGSVLIDFGLVRSLGSGAFSTAAAGWPALPPEMLERRRPLPQSDLFLAGRLLQARLTGKAEGKPALPREIPGWGVRTTLELERILLRALQPSPAERFPSAAHFRLALAKAVGSREGPLRLQDRDPRLVARKDQLAHLDAGLRGAAQGGAAAFWIGAAPGLGKSRLLAEVRLRAQLHGLEAIEMRFEADAPADATLRRKLRGQRRRDPSRRWLDALSPELGGTPAERCRRAAEAYFHGGGKPQALLLDDLHAADDESRRLALALLAECARRGQTAARGRGLIVVAASAATERDSVPAPAGCRILDLPALDARSSRKLLASLLQPLSLPPLLGRAALAVCGGSPRRLALLAEQIRRQWSRSARIPAAATLPELPPEADERMEGLWQAQPPVGRALLEALAIAGRAIGIEELAATAGASVPITARQVDELRAAGVLRPFRAGARRKLQLESPEAAARLRRLLPADRARELHRRAADWLSSAVAPGSQRGARNAEDAEHFARHLLGAGAMDVAARGALAVAELLRGRGAFDRAIRLLEAAATPEVPAPLRFEVIERLCTLLDETGDLERGIACLEPLAREPESLLAPRDRIRVARRLGVSYHRAGRVEEALAAFAAVERQADPVRDREDLIFVDSELAELHIFRGDYDQAEATCRRGLARIRATRGAEASPTQGRMEVMLHASLGHIELRRLALERARVELTAALELSLEHGTIGDQAAIRHNLGVTENQRCDLPAARTHFEEAARLLLRAGERRNLIKVATNLAVIEAKLGLIEAAEGRLDEARELLHHYPGEQIEGFFAYSQGFVALLAGEAEAARGHFQKSLAIARRRRDPSLARFSSLHAAEALLFSGDYVQAARELRAVLAAAEAELVERPAGDAAARVWQRMALARLALVEELCGRQGAVRRHLQALQRSPRTQLEYLEAWNDLCCGAARFLRGERGLSILELTRRAFHRLQTPLGERFALLLELGEAVAAADPSRIRRLLHLLRRAPAAPHRFLAVAEAHGAATAHVILGDTAAGERLLDLASGAIVGLPWIELDWCMELLRARLAHRGKDVVAARRYLYRAMHGRDLLLQRLPAKSRGRLAAHPRFQGLDHLRERIETRPSGTPRLHSTTPRLEDASLADGIVGRSAALRGILETVAALRGQDIAVLIRGETGTGKELIARAIRARSARRDGPFQCVHCACLPPELFEAELFGHEAGAFTGAEEARAGLLEELRGGTLLLDHVEQLPQAAQAKLLRALDAASVRRLGGTSARELDVRWLATTSLDLRAAVAAGTFRRDLYHRLAGLEIVVPPLRERAEDIAPLARHFLERQAVQLERQPPELTVGAAALLESHPWPGNVRELEALLLRALLQSPASGRLQPEHLRPLLETPAAAAPPRSLLGRKLDAWRAELEREYLTQLFIELRGDAGAMMRELGVRSTRLYAWMKGLGIDVRALRRQLTDGGDSS